MARYSALAELQTRPVRFRRDVELLRARRDEERRQRREAARTRAMEPTKLSPRPVVLLIGDLRFAEELAAAPRSRFWRRCAIFLVAAVQRGRGRIPKALRVEAERLNRGERLLQRLENPPARPDPLQAEFPFLSAMPKHLAPPDFDWGVYLRPLWEFRL